MIIKCVKNITYEIDLKNANMIGVLKNYLRLSKLQIMYA